MLRLMFNAAVAKPRIDRSTAPQKPSRGKNSSKLIFLNLNYSNSLWLNRSLHGYSPGYSPGIDD